MNELTSLMARNGFLPHGYCFTWQPGLLWSFVASDLLIAAAYFSIPLAMLSFMRKRGDVAFRGVGWLFCGFIFACGVTHLMDVWTIWQPDYVLHAVTKLATAGISVFTAVALWPLMPRALRIPTVAKLQQVIQSLESEVALRSSAEEQLAEIQQSLAVTLSSIGAGFIATDRDGRVTRMNSVAEQVTGWPQAQALGQPLWDVFKREDLPLGYEQRNPIDVIAEAQVDEQVAQYITAVSRQGARAALEVRAARTHARDGQVSGMAIVFRDLSEQMRIESERQRLAAIVESSSDAIISKTLDGRITSWNRGAQDLFGYSADEAIGQPVEMLIPPERAAEEMRLLTDLARGMAMPPLDTVRRAKDGTLREVSVSISPIRDARGRIVGASKIARDMGQQRRAERALRESEERLRFTLETSQIGAWDLDLASGRISRSRRHDQCFGYSNLQPEWTTDIFLDHVHPEDRARVQRRLEATVAQRKEWSEQYRVIWPDGSVHWLAAHGSIRVEAGRPTRMLGTMSDITAHKQAEEARLTTQRLQAENQQIQEANRLKSRFLANMSHELRTPLNAIIGFADLLHRGVVPTESDKHREYLGHIGSSGRHLLQLINDVLDLAKVEAGKFEFFPEPLQLAQAVQDVHDVLQPQLQRKQLQFSAELDPALGPLVLDPARLKQALFNYLSNAIKFTPEGGRITVRARPEGSRHVRIEVEDTGVGIAAADLPRLFTEFQQLDAGYGKHHQGTGLGLALVRRLVQAQGGSVGVRSELGVGSVFSLVLPRSPTDSAVPERLLVVEPDLRLQTQVVDGLAAAGYAVDAAADAAQALRHSQGHAYTGITLDLRLPDGAGLALLETIRSTGHNSEAPVVAVTVPAALDAADAGDGDKHRVATFVVTDVLSKPLHTGQVVNALARLRTAGRPLARVMVVDDDPLALDLMRATLTGMGLTVTTVQDGRQALREIDQHRPDAMVLDLMMPGFDGFAVLDALARLPGWQQLPVFIWTAMQLDDEELASLSQTARAVLGKGGGSAMPLLQGLRRRRDLNNQPG